MNKREFDKMLTKYADVIVKIGLNVRPGQRLLILAGITDYLLVRLVIASAYKTGARYVDVIWNDEESTHIHLKKAPSEALSEIPDWIFNGGEEFVKNGDALLQIVSSNPNIFSDVKPERVSIHQKTFAQKAEKILDALTKDEVNWSIVSMPSDPWALKVFPDTTRKQAVKKLWEAIFQSCRVDQQDPVTAWETHIANLSNRCKYLNTKKYSALNYTAPNTNLAVGLPKQHRWASGKSKAENGIEFIANMPTEEVFTLPHKNSVNGTVTGSRPFVIAGNIVENFSLNFENGKITNFSAQKGEESLRKLIETDEGSSRIGEVALVPHSSPISQRGHLFYNTLFDENAASHIAMGRAYRFTMEGGNEMTEDEFQANGGNFSLTHDDFMIGSAEMDIDGITADGSREPVMRQGEWAFDV